MFILKALKAIPRLPVRARIIALGIIRVIGFLAIGAACMVGYADVGHEVKTLPMRSLSRRKACKANKPARHCCAGRIAARGAQSQIPNRC
jgi:hypothetical protein